MTATTFTHALLRAPANSAVDGLRAVDIGAPDIERMRGEHQHYRQVLESLGVQTQVLPALENFPDSCFMEDPALVFTNGAILMRPGAETRFGEAAALAPVLEDIFPTVLDLGEGYAEGGDVLVSDDKVLIGLSARTDQQGAEALIARLAELGKKGVIVQTPANVLHFKTDCSLISNDTVLATKRLLAGGDFFQGLNVVDVEEGEEACANALCINGTVLMAEGFERTRNKLVAAGYKVVTLPLYETMKLDAGLSCMSLRWSR